MARRAKRSAALGRTTESAEGAQYAAQGRTLALRDHLPSIKVSAPASFRYTSPSTVGGKSSSETRRRVGCEEVDRVNKKTQKTERVFTGKRCATQRADGSCSTYYVSQRKNAGTTKNPAEAGKVSVCASSKTVPCSQARKGCNVQLIYRSGRPHLRFCVAQKQRGRIVPVRDAHEAARVAREVCQSFGFDPTKRGTEVRWPSQRQLDAAKAKGKALSSYPLGGTKGAPTKARRKK